MWISWKSNLCIDITTADSSATVIYAPTSLLHVDSLVDQDEDQWILYCLSETGNLYCINHAAVKERLKPKTQGDNQEIFTDLLSSDADGDDIVLEQATKPVYILDNADIVYHAGESPAGLFLTQDFVGIITQDETHYKVLLIKCERTFDKQILSSKSAKSLFFPKNNSNKYDNTCHKFPQLLNAKIIKIVADSDAKSTHQLLVSKTQYKQLFGQDFALLNSSVVLVCPLEGSLYFAPVSSFLSDHCNENCDASKWAILCQTSTKVVEVLNMTVAPEMCEVDSEPVIEDKTNLLLVCESNGGVTAFCTTEGKTEVSGILVSKFSLSEGTVCADVHHNKIFHSSGTHIYRHTVNIKKQNQTNSVKVTDARMCEYKGIIDIRVKAKEEMVDTEGGSCLLLCRHTNGEVIQFDSKVLTNQISLHSGEVLKNVLLSLEEMDLKRKCIKDQLSMQDKLLEQINIAAHLLRYNMQGHRHTMYKWEPAPFSCVTKARLDLETGTIYVDSVLTNAMATQLSSDWVIKAFLLSTSGINSACHVSKSVKLKTGLKSDEEISISLKVEPCLVLSGFYIKIDGVLQLDDCMKKRRACLPVTLYSQEVDILFFLSHPSHNVTQSLSAPVISSKAKVLETVQNIAERRPNAKYFQQSQQKGGDKKTLELLIKKGLDPAKLKTELDRNIRGATDVSTGILQYLLRNTHGRDLVTKGDICLTSYLGTPIFLKVSVHQGEVTPDHDIREIIHAEITIRSDVNTAAALHKAVQGRLEDLMMKKGKVEFPLKRIKKHINELKEIQGEINFVRQGRRTADQQEQLIGCIYQNLRTAYYL